MIGEGDVRGRYAAFKQEIEQLDREIDLLQLRVRMGSDQWRVDIEKLARCAERRRVLSAQLDALAWVLMPGSGEELAARHSGV